MAHLHRDYAVRAARAGVHVLCEKPMAMTEQDCRAMIAAARRARVKLMVAYRLHFEEANLRAVQMVRSGFTRSRRPRLAQQIQRPPARKPRLVRAQSPSLE